LAGLERVRVEAARGGARHGRLLAAAAAALQAVEDVAQRHEDGRRVPARQPLVGGQGRLLGGRVRVQVVLEELGLAGHRHRDYLAQAGVVELEEGPN